MLLKGGKMVEQQKTIVLTGGSQGIGHSTGKCFWRAGWRVITCSRQPFPKDHPGKIDPQNYIQIDLGNRMDLAAGIEKIRRRLDGAALNALVNNAAISPKGDGGKRLGSIDTSTDIWDYVFQVNFFAPIMLARGLIKDLERGKGSIVNVTSIAGSRVHPFAGTAYATSKAALSALTREMAADFGQHGIRVNSISPGEIDTSILSPGTEQLIEQIPLGRLGKPEEVAETIEILNKDN